MELPIFGKAMGLFWKLNFMGNKLVHQILSSCCYFCFLFPSTALKFLAVAMAMPKCRTIGLPNHRNVEPSDFALQKKIIFQKIQKLT